MFTLYIHAEAVELKTFYYLLNISEWICKEMSIKYVVHKYNAPLLKR